MFEVGKEFFVFVYAILSGMFLMLLYQFLQLLRCLIFHKLWIVNLEDIAFWIFTSFYLFLQMYKTTNGSIRWFFALGIVLGVGIAWYSFNLISKYIRTHKHIAKEMKKR